MTETGSTAAEGDGTALRDSAAEAPAPATSLTELDEPLPLTDDLVTLFRGEYTGGLTLGVTLPRGRVLPGELRAAGADDEPDPDAPPAAVWLSEDELRDAGACWSRLRAEHRASGLWPLLAVTAPFPDDGLPHPWTPADLMPMPPGLSDVLDAETFLAGRWDTLVEHARVHDNDLAPFTAWPGLAPAAVEAHDPDWLADRVADGYEPTRLALAAAGTGYGALVASGWRIRHDSGGDTPEVAAVVRSWEERFGARVLAAGDDALLLSVAAPPAAGDHALAVAAEHAALAPSVLGAGQSLADHAAQLPDADHWWLRWGVPAGPVR